MKPDPIKTSIQFKPTGTLLESVQTLEQSRQAFGPASSIGLKRKVRLNTATGSNEAYFKERKGYY